MPYLFFDRLDLGATLSEIMKKEYMFNWWQCGSSFNDVIHTLCCCCCWAKIFRILFVRSWDFVEIFDTTLRPVGLCGFDSGIGNKKFVNISHKRKFFWFCFGRVQFEVEMNRNNSELIPLRLNSRRRKGHLWRYTLVGICEVSPEKKLCQADICVCFTNQIHLNDDI